MYACEKHAATNQEEKPEIKPKVCFADVNDGKILSSLIYNLRITSGLFTFYSNPIILT